MLYVGGYNQPFSQMKVTKEIKETQRSLYNLKGQTAEKLDFDEYTYIHIPQGILASKFIHINGEVVAFAFLICTS